MSKSFAESCFDILFKFYSNLVKFWSKVGGSGVLKIVKIINIVEKVGREGKGEFYFSFLKFT